MTATKTWASLEGPAEGDRVRTTPFELVGKFAVGRSRSAIWRTQLPADWDDGTAHSFWSAAYAYAGVTDPVAVEAAVRSDIAEALGHTTEAAWRDAMNDDELMATSAHLLEPPGGQPTTVSWAGDRVMVTTSSRAFALDRSTGEVTGWLQWPAQPTGMFNLTYSESWDVVMSGVFQSPARPAGWSGVVATWTHRMTSNLYQQRPRTVAWAGGMLVDHDGRCAVHDEDLTLRGWLVDTDQMHRFAGRDVLWRGQVAALVDAGVAQGDVPARGFQCQRLADGQAVRLHHDATTQQNAGLADMFIPQLTRA